MNAIENMRQKLVRRKKLKGVLRCLEKSRNVEYLLKDLGELTPEEANKLMKSENSKVRAYALQFADEKSKLEQLSVEEDASVIAALLKCLGELTTEEANKFLKSKHRKLRNKAFEAADRKNQIEYLLTASEDELYYCFYTLERVLEELTTEEANQLLNAKYFYIRDRAAFGVDRKSAMERLLVEQSSCVISSILCRLGGELTIEEVKQLVKAKRFDVINNSNLKINYEGSVTFRKEIIDRLKKLE